MATIKVSDLRPAGYDLFDDFESFMTDLTDSELGDVNGGWTKGIGSWKIISRMLGFCQ